MRWSGKVRSATHLVLAGFLLALSGGNALADPPTDTASAPPALTGVWAPKELDFTFLGFTAKYSCDGLAERVRAAVIRLGARPDVTVRPKVCAGGFGRPSLFPQVHISMNVLVPVTETTDPALQRVPAHWQWADLTAARDIVKEAGDCEVVEQIKQTILPQFTTRAVDYKSTCIPHQLTIGGTTLRAEVPIATADAAAAAAPTAN